MKKFYFTSLARLSIGLVFSQITEGDSPISWEYDLKSVEPIELPPIDLLALQQEDSINDMDKSQPWRYGIARTIKLNPQSSGVWSTLENGDRIWRVAIRSPRAINISVNFDDFYLPPGARLQLYNGDRSDKSKSYSNENNRGSKLLGSWFVSGEIIQVEYYEPSNVVEAPGLEIGSIIHGYRLGRVSSFVDGSRGLNDSGDCNYDVNCSVGVDFDDKKDIIKRSVALLNLGNGYLCSASLLNNTLSDKRPYLLTANHCLEGSNPSLWSVRFNWMTPGPVCGSGENSVDIQSNFTMSGAEFRASNIASDFALVELYNNIPSSWDVTFAGWDISDDLPVFQVGIHHPNGDIMKICRDDDGAIKESANGTDVWLIKGVSAGNGNGWEIGTTESGSSGSPLFNETGRIIGQLYAGQAFCDGFENNGDYDIYGRMAVSWDAGTNPETRLKDWLDPLNSGINVMDALSNALSVTDVELTGRLDIYPNPASDYITVMNTQYPNLSFRFYNVVGQEVLSGSVSNSENRIYIQGMQEGIYFLNLTDEDSQNEITKKIIVDRL